MNTQDTSKSAAQGSRKPLATTAFGAPVVEPETETKGDGAAEAAAKKREHSQIHSVAARKPDEGKPLSDEELEKTNAYWRACNYLSAGMIYLCDNPLLREPLKAEHIKQRLLGHWGSDPGQSFLWVHLNRLIKKYDLNMIYISGPGHGAPATLSNAIWRGRTQRSIRIRARTWRGCGGFSSSSRFRAGLGVTARRRLRDRSMRAGSWGIACRMDLARRLIIRI